MPYTQKMFAKPKNPKNLGEAWFHPKPSALSWPSTPGPDRERRSRHLRCGRCEERGVALRGAGVWQRTAGLPRWFFGRVNESNVIYKNADTYIIIYTYDIHIIKKYTQIAFSMMNLLALHIFKTLLQWRMFLLLVFLGVGLSSALLSFVETETKR